VIYQRPRTNIPAADHEVFPYLLRDRNVGDIGAPHLIRPIDLEGCGGISRPGCHHGLREPQIIGPIRWTHSLHRRARRRASQIPAPEVARSHLFCRNDNEAGLLFATAVDPAILLIDEGIGAGDSGFADRAAQRMRCS
jgi:hypothetical protein